MSVTYRFETKGCKHTINFDILITYKYYDWIWMFVGAHNEYM